MMMRRPAGQNEVAATVTCKYITDCWEKLVGVDTRSRNKQIAKRQRTSSPSPSALSKQSIPASQPPSDDELKSKANGVKKPRGPPSRNPREKDTKELEEPEAERPEIRRKSRSERRRGEGGS